MWCELKSRNGPIHLYFLCTPQHWCSTVFEVCEFECIMVYIFEFLALPTRVIKKKMEKWNWAGPVWGPGHKSLSGSPILFFGLTACSSSPQALNLMPKVQPLCAPLLNRTLETVLGEVVKNSFLLCQAREGHSGLQPRNVSHPRCLWWGIFMAIVQGWGCCPRLGWVWGLRWSGLLMMMSFPLILPQVALLREEANSTPCWRLCVWLAFRCFCYYNHTQWLA